MNHLLTYYQTQKETIIQKIESLKKEIDVEELHELRVTHKRIRALFRMLKKINPDLLPADEDYNKIKEFYKIAGKLRDLHVQDRELKKHEENLGTDLIFLHEYIHNQEEEAEKKFKNALHSFDIEIFDRYEKQLEEGLKNDELYNWYKQVVDYTYQQLKNVMTTIDEADTAKKLHKVRSTLKDIFYCMEIINSEDSLDDVPDKEIKNAQSFLGDWHDHVVSFEFIKEFEKDNPQLAEKNSGTLEILKDYLLQKIHFN